MTATTFLPQSIYVGSAGLVGANAAGLCKVLTAEEAKPLVDLSAYLPLAGGTMTGQLGLNGHAKLGGVSAGVAAIYANDGVTLGTLQASTLSNPNGNLDFNCNSSDYRFYNGSNWIVIDPGNGSIDLRANNGTKQSAYFNKDGQINIGGGFQNTDGIRLTSLTGIVAVKQADGTTLGTLQARTIESSGTLTLKQSGTEAINFITGQAYIYSLLRPSVDNLYDCGVAAQRWRTGYFGTSVITPLVDNPTAALTLGNATYGVTVPGALTCNITSTVIMPGAVSPRLDLGSSGVRIIRSGNNAEFIITNASSELKLKADSGLKVRNAADSADASVVCGPLTCGLLTAAGSIILNSTWETYTSAIRANNSGITLVYRSTAVAGATGNTNRFAVWQQLGFASTSSATTISGTDLQLYRDAADILHQRRALNTQTFRLANTWTASTNLEALQLRWESNTARIGTMVGSAGGTSRNLELGHWDAAGNWTSSINIPASGGSLVVNPATTFNSTITVAGTAPLKIATGVLMTTPEAGAIEYDGTNLYFTDSGGTRRQLAVV
jgi:hypothetical protein